MPSRKKASSLETKDALERSLLEWGVKPSEFRGPHALFSQRIATQVSDQEKACSIGPVNIKQDDLVKLPQSLGDAIELVYTQDLREYLDEKKYNIRLENENLTDSLEKVLTAADKPAQILKWPPKYIDSDGVARKKGPFKRFDVDPFQRFKLGDKRFSKAELAYHQCNQDWRNGNAFEAIVASHAIHNEPCYSCNVKDSLFWCGGSDSSWRDLYCHSCKSCFEIKSKKDCKAIDTVFRFNNLSGGSYRRWCQEGFSERRIGRDYIVIVSREPSFSDSSEVEWEDVTLAWKVEIAEVQTALPRLTGMSFVDFAQQKERITLKTTVALQHRATWFRVQKHGSLDFEKILKRSFEKVFPGQWDEVANKSHKVGVVPRCHNVAPSPNHQVVAGNASRNALASRGCTLTAPDWPIYPSRTTSVTKNNSTRSSTSHHHHHGGFAKRSARAAISSLNSSLRELSIADEDYEKDYIDDYVDNDFYLSGRMINGIKGRQQEYVNINDKSMDLCKHNGYKMMDSGHYGKRRSSGRKKGGRKNDSDYYY